MKIPLFTHLSLLAAAICGIAAPPAAQAADIIAITDAWDYLSPTDGVDPATLDPDFATTWYNTDGSYDGPGFTNAAGPFSYGGITAIGNTGTFIGVGGTATAPTSGLRYTAYFKKQFTLDQDYNQLILEMILDDGAVIYIDGVERARLNMSSTTKANTTGDTYTMLANNAPDESTYFTPAALGALTAGTHTIAISLHNSETTSSDLGMAARVTLPTIVQTTFAGVTTSVPIVSGGTGWVPGNVGSFTLNSPGGTHVIESAPMDLTQVGEAYFAMHIFLEENSTGSNFEDGDSFAASLLITNVDDTVSEVSLLTTELDPNQDGKVSGLEFSPGNLEIGYSVVTARQLFAVIPEGAKSAIMRVTGISDGATGSEHYRFGGCYLRDTRLDLDTDGDGANDAAELFAGTDPTNPTSVLRISRFAIQSDATGPYVVIDWNAVNNRRYSLDISRDNGKNWSAYYQFGVANGTGGYTVAVYASTTAPVRLYRLSLIP